MTLVIFPNSVLPLRLPSPLSLKSCADVCDQRHGCPFNHPQTQCAIFCHCAHCAIIIHLQQLLWNLSGGNFFLFFTLEPRVNWAQMHISMPHEQHLTAASSVAPFLKIKCVMNTKLQARTPYSLNMPHSAAKL